MQIEFTLFLECCSPLRRDSSQHQESRSERSCNLSPNIESFYVDFFNSETEKCFQASDRDRDGAAHEGRVGVRDATLGSGTFLVSNGIIVRYYKVCYGAIRNFKLR